MVKELVKLTRKINLKNNIFILEFESNKIAKAKPGQFVSLLVEGLTLRRPFTILQTSSNKFKIGVKIKGIGTKKISLWSPGQLVDVLGPLGRGFLPPQPNDRILLVGGGVGCFALLELAKQFSFCQTVLGFKTADQIILKNEFEKHGPVLVCVENNNDASSPRLVTEPLENLIKAEKINRVACCGPLPLMKAVFKIAERFNVFCEVCLEERMACGIGSCLGCQCLVKKNEKLQSKHICCDGPVFIAKEVFF